MTTVGFIVLVLAVAIGLYVMSTRNDETGDETRNEPPQVQRECVVGGCSGTLCVSASDEPVFSTCEYAAWYACYREPFAVCEMQASGQCGWTPSAELDQCIADNQEFPTPDDAKF